MGWSNDEPQTKKQGMSTSSKILLAIIVCLILIIMLILVLLSNAQTKPSYSITVDGKSVSVNKDTLLAKMGDITYVNIEEFAKLVKYEYHQGEYKGYNSQEADKCYVQGINETASFFLNESKVSKLAVNDLKSDYSEYVIENTIKSINNKFFAPIEAIKLAFNVQITENKNSLTILTLNYLVTWYDAKVKEWGYTGIVGQNFENQKAILYGCLIVNKDKGLYKIIDTGNTKEIVSDKYTEIQFTENTKEFFVTNSLKQVGIINIDGTIKIEPIYESMSLLDKKSELYLVKKDEKYGVVKSGNITVIYPEYDSVGLDTKLEDLNEGNKYFILDTLIPVYKNEKWGMFDKEGKEVLKLEYDGLGCVLPNVNINGVSKKIQSVLAINECKGIVLKRGEKYKLLDVTGEELISTELDAIYKLENNKNEYYMLYNNQELNIIEKLIEAGIIEKPEENKDEPKENLINTIDNTINNNINSDDNTVSTSTNIVNSINNELV